MKKLKTKNIYKASNVYFDADTCQAYSYNWWRFVEKINGKVVFNGYSYSNSTSKHQYKVLSLLDDLNIKIDYYLECPKGLQDLNSGVKHYEYLIKELQTAILKPRSQAKKNKERVQTIETYQRNIETLKQLISFKKPKLVA